MMSINRLSIATPSLIEPTCLEIRVHLLEKYIAKLETRLDALETELIKGISTSREEAVLFNSNYRSAQIVAELDRMIVLANSSFNELFDPNNLIEIEGSEEKKKTEEALNNINNIEL